MLREYRWASRLTLSVVLFLMMHTLAYAQATRTWVSGVGDDANPCSRTAPCKTFAGAISKTAAGGEISVLDPGGFGAVTITKSILINGGESGEGGILGASTNGIIINAGPNDRVTLRGLTLEGAGTGLNGIRFLAGQTLHVENCLIKGFRGLASSYGISFMPSGATSSRLIVKNSVINDNGQPSGGSGGIYILPQGGSFVDATIENTTISNNVGWGIRADANSVVTVRNSSINSSWHNGVVAIGTSGPVQITVESSTISDNGWGPSGGGGVVASGGLGLVRISDNLITNNTHGIRVLSGGIVQSFGDNRIVGNGTDGAPTTTAGKL